MLSSRVETVWRVSVSSLSIALIRPFLLSLETRASSRFLRTRLRSRAFLSSRGRFLEFAGCSVVPGAVLVEALAETEPVASVGWTAAGGCVADIGAVASGATRTGDDSGAVVAAGGDALAAGT